MSRAWALAVMFFVLTIYAAFDGNPGTAIIFGVIGLCLAAVGSAGRKSEAREFDEGGEHVQPEQHEKNLSPPPWIEEQQNFEPAKMWRSAEPIPRGVQVAVHIEGAYGYSVTNDFNARYFADAHYSWSLGINPGHYKRHNLLYFDANPTPVTPFFEERQSHRYRFLYIGTGMRMGVFLRRDPAFSSYSYNAFTDDPFTIAIAPLSPADQELFRAEEEAEQKRREEEHRRQEEAAAAKREREARELEERRRHRLQTIEARYSKSDLAWRSDEAARARYAASHRDDLLSRRKAIIEAFEAFHASNSDLIDTLRVNHADWYGNIDEIFYFDMACIAENLPSEPLRDKTSPTPDERRERELSWSRVKTKDYREQTKLRLSEERDFIEELMREYPNLTEPELQQELQRFRDEALEVPTPRRTSDRAPGGPNGASQGRVL